MPQQIQPILINQFNMGGLADSKWSGIANSLYKMTGFDPHSAPGILRVAQKMTKNSGSTVSEFCKARLASSNGRTYWGSSTSGKIWERDANGNWSLVTTIAPSAGSANIMGLVEYQKTIYIITQSKIHKILATDAEGATEWGANLVSDWATFDNKDVDFHPTIEQNLVLYIGDGKQIAQIDAGVFSSNALDLADPLRIKSLGKISTRVLAGTYVSDNITKTQIFDWDTFSDSFRVSDSIDEVGINAFLEADNFVYAQCGLAGNFYIYDGEKLSLYKKIPGDYSPTAQAAVNPTSVANLEGQILFGVSNITGNPCDQGVYRIGQATAGYPYIMDFPYPVSERNGTDFVITNLEVGGVLVVGSLIMFAWKRTIPGSPTTYTYGVDMIDYANKLDGAYLETRVARVDRFKNSTFPKFSVAYDLLPTGTDIEIAYKKNYGDYTETDTKDDDNAKIIYTEPGVEATALQAKITARTNANTAPEIEAIQIPIQ